MEVLSLTAASSGTLDQFLAAVRVSHVATTRVELWSADGSKLMQVYPLDGSITTDARRSVRRSIDLTLADTDGTLTPTSRTSALAPFAGNQIKVWRGIRYPDGTTAEVPQGVFNITAVEVQRTAEGIQLQVTGEDPAWKIARKPFGTVKKISAGTNIVDAITAIMDDVMPGLSKSLTPTGYTLDKLKLGLDDELDPWETCRQLALAAGHELYFDPSGTLASSAIPVLSTASATVSFLEDANGVTLDLSRSLTSEDIKNGVKVTVEGVGTEALWSSSAYDTDPSSPTNVTDYGQNPEEVTTRLPRYIYNPITMSANTEQTDMMASAILQTVIGQPIDLMVVPNPALDVRDAIRVQSSRLGLDTVAIIDTIQMPLDPTGGMSIAARAKAL